MSYILEMKNITKRFGSVIANDNINFSLEHQEIHCILGENGTGKSTLMNILCGLYQADEGSILLNGKKVNIANSRIAFQLGIGMVHQHFMLVNRLSVLENIILGHEIGKYKLDLEESRKQVEEISLKYGFNLDLDAKVKELSVGMKQRVEIIKTLYRGADIIILDEPTAVLTPQEVDELMKILNDLKSQGKTIIFITHKLNETMEVADRITVLRNGKHVITINKSDTNPKELARYMVGRDVSFTVEKEDVKLGETVLSIRNLALYPDEKKTISLDVRAGEIVGIAGVAGNGQQELEEIIMGLSKVTEGNIVLNSMDITSISTRQRKRLGMGYIPSDRHKRAMLSKFSVAENYLLGYQFGEPFVKNKMIQRTTLIEYSKKLIEQFGVKVAGSSQNIGQLSGGNQQKVIVGREVSQEPCVVIAAQPIRGLDIGAIEYIHNVLLRLRSEGKAILLISAELSEILQLSDRIAVFYEGEIMALRETKDFSREEIGLLMAGRKECDMLDEK